MLWYRNFLDVRAITIIITPRYIQYWPEFSAPPPIRILYPLQFWKFKLMKNIDTFRCKMFIAKFLNIAHRYPCISVFLLFKTSYCWSIITVMGQSPFWATNSHAASQDIPPLYCNPNVHYRVHKQGHASLRACKKIFLYNNEMLALSLTPKLKYHLLSAVRDYLFTIFTAAFYIWSPSSPSATRRSAMPWWEEPT
jgi:hypothetical protein